MSNDPALNLPLPHRLDIKPNVFFGLNWPECLYAILIASACSIGVGLVIGTYTGKTMMVLPTWLVLGTAIFIMIAKFMAKYKHNRPYGYYQQKIFLALQRLGFGRWFITRSGYRDPRRLNCNYSPDQLDEMKLQGFIHQQNNRVSVLLDKEIT